MHMFDHINCVTYGYNTSKEAEILDPVADALFEELVHDMRLSTKKSSRDYILINMINMY